ncbi:MAG: 23S rRNA (adenine(2503)-C(2))-methyltransferase RlmN, partial [Clostridium sp.]
MYNILDFTLEELQNWMKENGESAFRAKQVFSWIYKEVWNFDEMKNIPRSLKEKLKENFTIEIPKIIEVYESNVDGTKKMLLSMKDNN